jgi:hypothetical protein
MVTNEMGEGRKYKRDQGYQSRGQGVVNFRHSSQGCFTEAAVDLERKGLAKVTQ